MVLHAENVDPKRQELIVTKIKIREKQDIRRGLIIKI